MEPTALPSTMPSLRPLASDIAVTFVQASPTNTFPIFDPVSLAALRAQETPHGIWFWAAYKPNKAHRGIYPGLKGAMIIYRWSQLEPSQGMYNWTEVNRFMARAISGGLKLALNIQVGPESPEWLYRQGVPKVLTTATGFDHFPHYFDPLYLKSFDLMKNETMKYLLNMPANLAESLVAVTLSEGSTGDPYCYKGDLLPGYEQFAISQDEWDQFRRQNIQDLHDYLGPEGREKIGLSFVHMTDETEALAKELFPNLQYFKNGMASHGYHIPDDEALIINVQRSQAFDGDPALGGARIRWFGEMDSEWKNGWFQRSPKESFWWSAIYALHMGLSRWHVEGDALEIPEYHFVCLSTWMLWNCSWFGISP
jgi:hypothetical protein